MESRFLIKGFRSLLAVALFVCWTASAYAAIIVDSGMEKDENGWVSSGGWYSESGVDGLPSLDPFFSPPLAQEGSHITHSNPGLHSVTNADVSEGTLTLTVGTYTIYFSAGNYSNVGFAPMEVTFAGMNESTASTVSKTVPGSGTWSLWSLTWDVVAGDANIGSALDFSAVATGTFSACLCNAALDGVGDLSALGSGFLVEYIAPNSVPEPSTLGLLGLGLLGIRLGVSGRKRI